MFPKDNHEAALHGQRELRHPDGIRHRPDDGLPVLGASERAGRLGERSRGARRRGKTRGWLLLLLFCFFLPRPKGTKTKGSPFGTFTKNCSQKVKRSGLNS